MELKPVAARIAIGRFNARKYGQTQNSLSEKPKTVLHQKA
jgi:hypothetical protein